MSANEVEGSAHARYRLNEPAVITDVIDEESVIMNLTRGSYYGLSPMGSELWQRIVGGMTVNEIVEVITSRFGDEARTARDDLEKLLAQMHLEELIVAMPSGSPADPEIAMVPVRVPRYETPVLTVYADMTDLLALDPPLPG